MGLGNRIKIVRGDLTQKEFAKKIGVHTHTAQLYEQGNIPKGDVLQRICEKFRININWLLTGEGEPYIKKGNFSIKEPRAPYGTQEEYEGEKSDEIIGKYQSIPPGPDEQFKLSDALTMAAYVLESKTSYSAALYINIQHFYRAIKSEMRIAQLEKRMFNLEKKLLESDPSKICRDESCERRVA